MSEHDMQKDSTAAGAGDAAPRADDEQPNDFASEASEVAGAAADAQNEPAAGATTDVAQLRRERDDLYDRLLRKSAEFDNYRKRIDRERRELTEWAAADVLTDVLSVLDDFERALSAPAPAEAEPYRIGVELIHRQLADLLKKRGVTPIDAIGSDFDPHVHQAVAYEETPGAREGEVVGELRRGYRLGERLLRPAYVKVAKAS